jgi:hypothetical protein
MKDPLTLVDRMFLGMLLRESQGLSPDRLRCGHYLAQIARTRARPLSRVLQKLRRGLTAAIEREADVDASCR